MENVVSIESTHGLVSGCDIFVRGSQDVHLASVNPVPLHRIEIKYHQETEDFKYNPHSNIKNVAQQLARYYSQKLGLDVKDKTLEACCERASAEFPGFI